MRYEEGYDAEIGRRKYWLFQLIQVVPKKCFIFLGICILGSIVICFNKNHWAFTVVGTTILAGLIDIGVRYKTYRVETKWVVNLRKIVGIIYFFIYLGYLIVIMIGILSMINNFYGYNKCLEGDMTCIRVDPVNDSRMNRIYNNYPLTYRSSSKKIKYLVKKWAEFRGHQHSSISDNSDQIIVIDYLVLFHDIIVIVEECGKGYVQVKTQGQIRLGIQDLTSDSSEAVEDLYKYLKDHFSPNDYSFTFCKIPHD